MPVKQFPRIDDPDYWRFRATNTRELAKESSDSSTKSVLTKIAEAYEALAERAAERKGRPSAKIIAREFPFVVEILMPEGGLGRRLEDMHVFHRHRRITDHHIPRRRDGEHDYIRWCFKDLATAEAFAAQFSGTLLPKRS